MFKTLSESLFDEHQDIFEGLIVNLDFRNANLVKKIMTLVCMLGTKNEHYSQKVMEQLIERFYQIRTQPNFDDKIRQVITELTNSIPQEKVFMDFSKNLENHKDLQFVQELIDRLTLVSGSTHPLEAAQSAYRTPVGSLICPIEGGIVFCLV